MSIFVNLSIGPGQWVTYNMHAIESIRDEDPNTRLVFRSCAHHADYASGHTHNRTELITMKKSKVEHEIAKAENA